MTEIAKKKFEILDFVISDEFTVDELSNKLNELTYLVNANSSRSFDSPWEAVKIDEEVREMVINWMKDKKLIK